MPDIKKYEMSHGHVVRSWGMGRISSLSFLLVFLLGSCVTTHSVTLYSDRSAFVASSGSFQHQSHNWNRKALYSAAVIRDVDTSQIHGLGQDHHFIIEDIDSLGSHLATFSQGHIGFALKNDELLIRSQNDFQLRKGWSRCNLTLFIEQGIKEVRSSNKVRQIGPNIISLNVPRRLLKKRSNAVDIAILLRPDSP